MRRTGLGAILALAGVGLSLGAARAADQTDTAAVARGEQLAQRNCAGCHAVSARGTSPNVKAPPFRELHRRYPAETLDEAFRRGLLTRHPAMPEFRFLPREINDLTAYVRALRARGVKPA